MRVVLTFFLKSLKRGHGKKWGEGVTAIRNSLKCGGGEGV